MGSIRCIFEGFRSFIIGQNGVLYLINPNDISLFQEMQDTVRRSRGNARRLAISAFEDKFGESEAQWELHEYSFQQLFTKEKV